MKDRTVRALRLAGAAALFSLAPRMSLADDESGQVSLELTAPLEAVNCATAPPTATILGATFLLTGTEGDDDAIDCAGLLVGSMVEAEFASAVAPLSIAEIQPATLPASIEIQGPVEAVDASAQTVTVLGITANVAGAGVEGSDDDDATTIPIDLATLIPGQIISMELDAAQVPALVAFEVKLMNYTNQVEVVVEDEDGTEVEDVNDDGSPNETMDVSVTERVRTPGGVQRKTTLQLNRSASGRFVLSGLPTGNAKVTVIRDLEGTRSAKRKSVKIVPNVKTTVRLKLRPAR